MKFRRYTVVVRNAETAAERQVTIPLLPVTGVVVALALLPALVGMGARWATRAEVQELTATSIALRLENDSYRHATGSLTEQVMALQSAVDEIGVRAAVDPEVSRVMDRLPNAVKNRAMGGGSAAVAPLATPAQSSPEKAVGVVRDILGAIEDRLTIVRSGLERRSALAAATPSIWPVTGWLSSPFGGRRDPFTGDNDFHPGLDISSPQGEPVLAPAAGVVSFAAGSSSYGNLVVLDHGFGIVTKYGHLSRFAVAQGRQVTRGEVIGYVGSTGRSTSPHLHYEIWMNGRLTDPLPLLAQR